MDLPGGVAPRGGGACTVVSPGALGAHVLQGTVPYPGVGVELGMGQAFAHLRRGQQFAQQMQQQNPELIEQLRSQIRSRTPSASNDDQQE